MIQEILINVGKGALIAGFNAFVGYITKGLPEGEGVDWGKALPMIAIGVVAGGYAAFNNIDIATAEAFLAVSGITALLNFVLSSAIKAYKRKQETGAYFVKK